MLETGIAHQTSCVSQDRTLGKISGETGNIHKNLMLL